MSEPVKAIGEMRGTARLVFRPNPAQDTPEPVKEEQQEDSRPECREKDEDHGR